MYKGFVRVGTATPEIRTADVAHNRDAVLRCMRAAEEKAFDVTVFPELVLTGAACGDLFLQESLLRASKEALLTLQEATRDMEGVFFVGLPVRACGAIYNGLACINRGKLRGITTKNAVDGKVFSVLKEQSLFLGVPLGPGLLYESASETPVILTAEIGEDAFAPLAPSLFAAQKGAVLVLNAAAHQAMAGRHLLPRYAAHAERLHAGYVVANGNPGDSTTDASYERKSLFVENGDVLDFSEDALAMADIHVERLLAARDRDRSFVSESAEACQRIEIDLPEKKRPLERSFDKFPFAQCDADLERVFAIQVAGLEKRMKHVHAKTAVIGISGGLDSTLALLVLCRTFDNLHLDRKGICAVTMPCFGTSDRTYQNACRMAEKLQVSLREVSIKDAVQAHFADIGHDAKDRNVTFENAQARERTQVLMDIANDIGGFVVGTGDMSELALGWATYNGDQMSMYGVNAGVPKTVVRRVTAYLAETEADADLRQVLLDVVDTPVSPELLPPKEGKIHQKTEDLVGPYSLHDFFLYHFVGEGLRPGTVYRMAVKADRKSTRLNSSH